MFISKSVYVFSIIKLQYQTERKHEYMFLFERQRKKTLATSDYMTKNIKNSERKEQTSKTTDY